MTDGRFGFSVDDGTCLLLDFLLFTRGNSTGVFEHTMCYFTWRDVHIGGNPVE